MRLFARLALVLAGLMPSAAVAAPVADAATLAAVQSCKPARPCAAKLPVRVVVVTMFEIGKDTGDKPGEFQLWKERRHLTETLPFPQGWHNLAYDP